MTPDLIALTKFPTIPAPLHSSDIGGLWNEEFVLEVKSWLYQNSPTIWFMSKQETPIEKTSHGRDSNPPCGWFIPEELDYEWEIFKQQAAKIPHYMNMEGIRARAAFWNCRDDY